MGIPDDDAWGAWHPADLARRLHGLERPWCVVGGWALDLWHGRQTRDHEDLELATGHYNSRQMAAKRASGFRIQHSTASRLRGGKGRRGGRPFDPHVAERVVG